MTQYIALLRGINVSGQKIIKMEALRESLAAAKIKEVQTYLQSGNILFSATRESPQKLAAKIEKVIKKDFGFDFPTVVVAQTELAQIFASNPWAKQSKVETQFVYVTFFSTPVDLVLSAGLEKLKTSTDKIECCEQHLYFYCPGGYGRTKLNNNAIEKILKVVATTRNWNTVTNLLKLASSKN